MKLSNLLQLTEHHRYVVVRRFGLSPLDSRMLWTAYQPLVGGFAVSLYMTLYSGLHADMSGIAEPTALGQLFLSVGLEPNEKGRKTLVDETAKLEAVGLLQTFRLTEDDGEVTEYEFRLLPPLLPEQFFVVHHLWLLLQERLGASAAEHVRRSFLKEGWGGTPDERREDISAPFYEVFRMRVPAGGGLVDEGTPGFGAAPEAAADAAQEFGRDGFRRDELLRRFPRSSPNRRQVERLLSDAGKLAELNYHAGRFELTLKQTVSLLDEEGMFGANGEWIPERFQARAADMYRQANAQEMGRSRTARKQELARGEPAEAHAGDAGGPGSGAGGVPGAGAAPATGAEPGKEREVPAPYWLEVPEQFQGQCDVRQYNMMLANAPYTRVLKLFFHPSAVPAAVEEAFLQMNVNYQLPDEVINVMIHYIRANDLDWKRNYLDAIGANVAGKRIRSFENAVVYFRRAEQARSGARTRGDGADGAPREAAGRGDAAGGRDDRDAPARKSDGRRGRSKPLPVIPVARSEGKQEATEEDIQRILEMAKRLNGGNA